MVPDGYDWLRHGPAREAHPAAARRDAPLLPETHDIQKLHQDVVARGYTPQNRPPCTPATAAG
jgi:hypothetical protein